MMCVFGVFTYYSYVKDTISVNLSWYANKISIFRHQFSVFSHFSILNVATHQKMFPVVTLLTKNLTVKNILNIFLMHFGNVNGKII